LLKQYEKKKNYEARFKTEDGIKIIFTTTQIYNILFRSFGIQGYCSEKTDLCKREISKVDLGSVR